MVTSLSRGEDRTAVISLSRGEDRGEDRGEERGEAGLRIFFLMTLSGLTPLRCDCVKFCEDKLFSIGTFLLTNIFLFLIISAAVTICRPI